MHHELGERIEHVVTAQKIMPEYRDVYAANGAGYKNGFGGDDAGEDSASVGERVVYARRLTYQEAEAFRNASNCVSVEPNIEMRAVRMPGQKFFAEHPDGVEAGALAYLGFDAENDQAPGVLLGVGDTGVDLSYLPKWMRDLHRVSWSWFNDDGVDRNRHGTWCVGAAVSRGVEWVSGKVLGDNGSGSLNNVAGFIRKFTALAVRLGKPGVVSLSLSGRGTSDTLQSAIRDAWANNVIVFVAAGNDSQDASGWTPSNVVEAVTCGAENHRKDQPAGFTNFGEIVDFFGPGVNLAGMTGTLSGTSMTTPLLARLASPVLAETGRVDDTLTAIVATARKSASYDSRLGIPNAARALAYLAPPVPVEPEPEPTPPEEPIEEELPEPPEEGPRPEPVDPPKKKPAKPAPPKEDPYEDLPKWLRKFLKRFR